QLKESYADSSGRALELIDSVSGALVGWPLAITTGDPKLDKAIDQGLYVVRSGDGAHNFSFDFSSEGIQVRKELVFDANNYQFTVSTSVQKNGEPIPFQLNWFAGFGDQNIPDDPKRKNAVYDSNSKFVRVGLSGIKAPQDVTTSFIGA